ncbi:hypothetical protein Xcel_2658 [Xylanimonas cellulosilytica DSM 15894]|uniref:Glycoside hydrolase family 65 central catalytic n=1 Tax=Xylanimonas cellulosilytica (strain DSM 15894 / JCM 12276 / CECT 5975 / KCTC 9989 / LMG 20990 / NBRC 107835 / XIL07) TaxID=446471 RepID=D1BXA4_XYLCX|nr:hypothetical protein [Xylanimonas cellulosilytica]ACZ31672.1 hypothetical protein Xcel_2658 [Xylanimonas cellulosilytica DSM 15894]
MTSPYAAPATGRVDRDALLDRHSPRVTAIDPRSPLQVGNGELAFTADVTGLQTLPESYPVAGTGTLLGTMAQWSWHSVPFDTLPGVPPGTPEPTIESTLREYDSPRGPVPYVDLSTEQWGEPGGEPSLAEEWLRSNPHRLDLGRIGLWLPGGVTADDVTDVDQRLDLATGVLTSAFTVRDQRFRVTTAVHPERDELAIRVERAPTAVEPVETTPPPVVEPTEPTPPRAVEPAHTTPPPVVEPVETTPHRDPVSTTPTTGPAAVGLELAFPYGSQAWGDAQDWNHPEAHTTTVTALDGGFVVGRVLDGTRYTAAITVTGVTLTEPAPHHIRLVAEGGSLQAVIAFAPAVAGSPQAALPEDTFPDVVRACADGWGQFWADGAAISFDGTADPRAAELERRIVLSQYVTAINCAGSTPPAETGLMLNSWRGRFHLEMTWWHTAAFPLWGRPALLERTLAWYATILEPARATAARQGFAGARWPKQTDPSGAETPSSIGTFLVWQQPHPIYLAELLYRASPTPRTLRRWAPIVRASAEFMASFAWPDGDGFHLPAPLVPAQESYARERATTRDPTFELAYWAWGLRVAVQWCERLGEEVPPLWREVAAGMWRPQPRDGVYPAVGVEPWTIRTDHPSMLAALGVVPETGLIDHDVMAATLDDVVATGEQAWDWDSTWGWDYPMGAMTAARLGRPEAAVDWLLADRGKNEHLPNGHNFQTPELPVYLPGNGGLLTAVALMAGGWDGAPHRPAPGFPSTWRVQAEGFTRLP